MDTSKAVLKTVAVFEAAKGVLLLSVGIGAWSLVHHDIRMIAAAIVGRLHLNPTHGFAGSFIEAASQLTDARLWMIAIMGCGYSAFRLLESYGLWFGKVWAEWLAVISGGIFVPLEIYELVEKVTWVRISALIINIVVVCAMAAILVKNRRSRKASAAQRLERLK